MSGDGWYTRIQYEKDGVISDSVKIKIESDSPAEREECFKDLITIHHILEKHGVFKKTS